MDVLTREAIDERLRVLGRVDEVVNMCINELTRLRSVLPPVRSAGTSGSASGVIPPPPPTPMSGVSAVDASGTKEETATDGSSEKARGKEKANSPIHVEEGASDSGQAFIK